MTVLDHSGPIVDSGSWTISGTPWNAVRREEAKPASKLSAAVKAASQALDGCRGKLQRLVGLARVAQVGVTLFKRVWLKKADVANGGGCLKPRTIHVSACPALPSTSRTVSPHTPTPSTHRHQHHQHTRVRTQAPWPVVFLCPSVPCACLSAVCLFACAWCRSHGSTCRSHSRLQGLAWVRLRARSRAGAAGWAGSWGWPAWRRWSRHGTGRGTGGG
jgi:hypothetical protein